MTGSFSSSDYAFMARAIRLAWRGKYTTHPNPRVGCVLVKSGEIIGEGYHRKAGEAHAERNALAAAGEAAVGSTAYVTLEPCSHHGRTPPCSEALIESRVSRVVIAMTDPNPLVSGSGIEQLQAAGIEVETGLLEAQARALNPGFIKRMEQGLPWLQCKLAASLDGRTAMASGESKWISSDHSRQDVQRLRARASAILTGVGTVLADDPSLNVRLDHQQLQIDADLGVRQPLRVILDASLQTPPDAKILQLPGASLIFCDAALTHDPQRYAATDTPVVPVSAVDGRLDLEQVLRHLASLGINEVLLESGATLAGQALAEGLVDELVLYLAPHLMGSDARGLFHLPGLEQMQQRKSLHIIDERRFGDDLRITATLSN
ncbi:MAG: bifunctional diaminohydroxyphosphoribosylaminopyrimidine deaminase/5-amino-6-(5-phosphoribosylamino)uracil reductase RibD [Chromatiales bacterium]